VHGEHTSAPDAVHAIRCHSDAMSDVRDRSIIVVGATGGLGAPLVAALAASGARLTVAGRSPERLADLGVDAAQAVVDVRKPGAAASVLDTARQRWGGVDGVVFIAGAVAFGSVADTEDDVLIELFTLNALAPMRLLRAAIPDLRASAAAGRDPFVLNVSAVVAEQPMAGMAAYSAAKAALAAYDQAAQRELRREGIRLIDARPPHTETGLATRPIAGAAPRMPEGLAPEAVAQRLLRAIVDDEKDLPSTSFAD